MPNLATFIIMDAVQAAGFREATAGAAAQLDPILVRGGDYAGQCILPVRVKTDLDFEDLWPELSALLEVTLDIEIAFPPIEVDLIEPGQAEA